MNRGKIQHLLAKRFRASGKATRDECQPLTRIAGCWTNNGVVVVLTAIAWIAVAALAGGADTAANATEPDLTALSLEELGSLKVATVYAASKFEQKTTEAPSSVTHPRNASSCRLNSPSSVCSLGNWACCLVTVFSP